MDDVDYNENMILSEDEINENKFYEKEEQLKSAIIEPSVSTDNLKIQFVDETNKFNIETIKTKFYNLNIRELATANLSDDDYIYINALLSALIDTERFMLDFNIDLISFYRSLYAKLVTTLSVSKGRKGIGLKSVVTHQSETVSEVRRNDLDDDAGKPKKKSLFDTIGNKLGFGSDNY